MKKSAPTSAKLRKLVGQTIREQRRNMNLQEWHFQILYMTADKVGSTGEGKVAAEIKVDRRYLTGLIYIYPRAIDLWKTDGDYFIESTIAHEMAHCLTEHLKDLVYATFKDEGEVKDAWEALTQRIARISLAIPKKKK